MTAKATDWCAGLPPIILASASPRREELLRQLGLTFEVVPSHAREVHEEQLTAREVSQLNAYRKAREIAKLNPDALVLGADTLVYLGTELFGKPSNIEEALVMLEKLQGHTHEVVTAICLLHLREHRQKVFAESTAVTFHRLTTDQMMTYFKKVNPLDKAGAYAIQQDGHLIVEKIDGSYSNVVGLPVERLEEELREWVNT
jgi:septum formation protein